VSAINSGLELIEENDSADNEQMLRLTRQSAETAVRRLVFLRGAFGYTSASSFGSIEPVFNLIQAYCEPIKIDFRHSSALQEADPALYPVLGRILLNLSLIVSEIAPFGGTYTLTVVQDEGQLKVGISLEGNIVELRSDLSKALLNQISEADVTSQTIQAFMTGELIRDLGAQFVLHESTRTSFSCGLIPNPIFK